DTWVGPATMVPYQANRLHGVWRWWHHFGTGDMGNDGVHDLDVARWGLGVDTHPSTITALGGKYFFDDDQEFPDTQTVVFEWPSVGPNGRKKMLIFEQRIWTPYKMEGYENGDGFYGTNGMMIFGKEAGWRLYGPRNKELKTMSGRPDLPAHHRNFFDCIRKNARPHGDIEIQLSCQVRAVTRLPSTTTSRSTNVAPHTSASKRHLRTVVTVRPLMTPAVARISMPWHTDATGSFLSQKKRTTRSRSSS